MFVCHFFVICIVRVFGCRGKHFVKPTIPDVSDPLTSIIFLPVIKWAAPSEFGTYRLCEQRRFRRACASAQSRQNLRCSLIQAVSQEEPSDRKPDPWPLWMAGHAQLKFVMTECSKTQIRLARLKSRNKVEFAGETCGIPEPPHDKTNKMASAPSEDSAWAYPSLIRVFAVRMKKAWALSYPSSAQQRLWSDWVDAQAYPSLCWMHWSFCWFCHEAAHFILQTMQSLTAKRWSQIIQTNTPMNHRPSGLWNNLKQNVTTIQLIACNFLQNSSKQ